MAGSLTEQELAGRARTTVERVREMAALGIVTAEAGYDEDDLGRVVVVEALASGGVSLLDLASAVRAGALSLSWFGGVLPPVPDIESFTYREALQRAEIPVDLVERLFTFWGVALPPLEEPVRDDDAVLISHLGIAFAAMERDERLMLASARYFGEYVRRIAESQMDFYRRELIEPRLNAGVSIREVTRELGPFIADVVRPGVHELLIWLYRRHIDTLNIQLLVQLVESSLQQAGVKMTREVRPPTIAFLDLSGFTRLTDDAGDEEAVALATILTDLVRTRATESGGTVVKLLGDGVMFRFDDAMAAITCSLQVVDEAEGHGLPPARVGMHAGPVVFRDGDYFGRTVNIAARITDYARPKEVLVSGAVRSELPEDMLELVEIGPVALKGVSELIPLYAVRPA